MAEMATEDARVSDQAKGHRGRFAPVLLAIGVAVAVALAVAAVVLGCLLFFLPQLDGPDPVSVLKACLAIASAWFVVALIGGFGAVTVVRWPRETACVVGVAVVAGAAVVLAVGLPPGRDLPVPELMVVWLLSAMAFALASVSAVRRTHQ